MENLVLRYNRLVGILGDPNITLDSLTVLDLRYCLSVVKSDIDSLGFDLVYDDFGFIVDYSFPDVLGVDYSFVSKILNHHLYRSFYVDLNGIKEKSFILNSIDVSKLSDDELDMFNKGFVKFEYVYVYRRRQRKNFVKSSYDNDVRLKRVRCNVEYIPVDVDEFIKST